jgi:hypothetical protein
MGQHVRFYVDLSVRNAILKPLIESSMLQISTTSARALEAAAWPAFIERVREGLVETYPDILGSFGRESQQIIVENMLGRAHYWGVSRQDACLAFCEFMLEIAPNFDEHPIIRAALSDLGGLIDDIVLHLPDDITEATWDDAELNAQDLPLFISADNIEASIEVRTQEALAFLLPEAARDWSRLLTQARKDGERLKLLDIDDSVLALAVWHHGCGEQRFDTNRHPFVEELSDFSIPGGVRLALLKFQITLDLQRFI